MPRNRGHSDTGSILATSATAPAGSPLRHVERRYDYTIFTIAQAVEWEET